jgi:hypothetical protein
MNICAADRRLPLGQFLEQLTPRLAVACLPAYRRQGFVPHLKITSQEWVAFLDDFQQRLDKFKVPAPEQAELKAIVDSTRADIVTG